MGKRFQLRVDFPQFGGAFGVGLTAIGAGFIGVLIILQPGVTVFSPAAIVPLIAALLFAIYGLLTRYAARQDDTATSFFWTGTVGAEQNTIGILDEKLARRVRLAAEFSDARCDVRMEVRVLVEPRSYSR